MARRTVWPLATAQVPPRGHRLPAAPLSVLVLSRHVLLVHVIFHRRWQCRVQAITGSAAIPVCALSHPFSTVTVVQPRYLVGRPSLHTCCLLPLPTNLLWLPSHSPVAHGVETGPGAPPLLGCTPRVFLTTAQAAAGCSFFVSPYLHVLDGFDSPVAVFFFLALVTMAPPAAVAFVAPALAVPGGRVSVAARSRPSVPFSVGPAVGGTRRVWVPSMSLTTLPPPPPPPLRPPTPLPHPDSDASDDGRGGGGDGVVVPIASVADFLSAMAASAAGGRVAVVGFYAPYCRACGAVRPRVAKEAAARSGSAAAAGGRGVDFYSVDCVAVRELAVRLGVRAMPAFHFYDGGRGKVEDFVVGPRSVGRLVSKLNQLDEVMG